MNVIIYIIGEQEFSIGRRLFKFSEIIFDIITEGTVSQIFLFVTLFSVYVI